MNSDKKTKKIIGLIAFLVGILLIAFSIPIPLINAIINIIGAILMAYGILNLMDIFDTIKSDSKSIIGLIAFIVGVILINFSDMIPQLNILIIVVGALFMAFGVLNIVHTLLNHL